MRSRKKVRPTSPAALQQSGFPSAVRELATRINAELREDVRQMRAGRPRRDAERGANLLVRAARRNKPHDFELAAGQSGDSLRSRSSGRPRTELAQLLARCIQLTFRAQVREYFVRAAQLAS